VIIKVTRTPLNGSRLDHRQAGAAPPATAAVAATAAAAAE